MTENVAVIILAAGKGTRMKSKLPKVMHEIAGKPMLGWTLSAVDSIAPTQTVLVLGPDMEPVEQLAKAYDPDIKIAIQKERLGTGDAVKVGAAALQNFEGLIYIMYADTPFIQPETLEAIDEMATNENAQIVVLGFDAADPKGYGRLMLMGTHELLRIVEDKDLHPDEHMISICNSGVMAFHSDMLPYLDKLATDNNSGEYYLTDLPELAREDGHYAVVYSTVEEEVMGINNRTQLSYAENLVQDWLRYELMENGVTLVSPGTVFLSPDVTIEPDVVIHPFVTIGPNTHIESDVEIRSFSHIEGAIIKAGATIGPYARLRPDTEIGEGSRIGNFVEIKKSTLGKGAKVSHLSYIGDAEVGKGANVGAGVVTCNYDGFNKFITKIAEGAFIGSNSSLVAPVSIGKGAIVGAGSTVLEDVDADALAINEMPQRNMPGRAKAIRDKKDN